MRAAAESCPDGGDRIAQAENSRPGEMVKGESPPDTLLRPKCKIQDGICLFHFPQGRRVEGRLAFTISPPATRLGNAGSSDPRRGVFGIVIKLVRVPPVRGRVALPLDGPVDRDLPI